EIMYDPLGTEVDEEWVELYNNGSTIVNLENWTFTDQDGTGDDFKFPDVDFPPNTYILLHTGVGVNDSDFSDDVAHFYLLKGSAMWSPDGDDVLLKNDTGVGVDYVAYGEEGYADPPPSELSYSGPNCSAIEGNSISLHPNGVDMDSGSTWEESDPTPGRANAHLNDDPPTISEVRHLPLNPISTDSVTITANVTDYHSLKSVTLHYEIDDAGYSSLPMDFDGTNFTVDLPAQADGTHIDYYIEAVDDAEQNSTSSNFCYAYSNLPPQVMINEFLPDPGSDWNCDGFVDNDDEWIELYNKGDTWVNIGGWRLDDKLGPIGSSDPYMIPYGCAIGPYEFMIFFCNETGIVLNDFGEENVTLLNETEVIIDIYHYSDSSNNTAMGRFPDGSDDWKNFLLPTPGANNRYPVDSMINLSNIRINEFLPSPKSEYSQDWIELYNSGTTPVKLDGCWLDDIQNGGTKPWQIPLDTTIQPDEVMLFEKSFGLNNGGDTVNLLYVDKNTVLDTFSYDSSEYDISFGRGGDGENIWVSFSFATPGGPNIPYQEPSSQERSVIISELFYKASEEFEYISIYNPQEAAINIGGWRILDGQYSYSGTILFPENAQLPLLEHFYIANNALIFHEIMGFYPDFEYGNSSPAIPDMISHECPSFAIQKDEALLLDEYGSLIDIIIYGDSEFDGPGWTGSPIPDAIKGEFLRRNFDHDNPGYEDTNTSLDWEHIRHYKPGQSRFEYESHSYTGNMTLFASPDSSYDAITKEIESAQSTIYIGLYQFTNWNVSGKIIERLNDGVEVKILIEGDPAGERPEEQNYILQKIHENGGEVRFLVSNTSLGSRYRYIHSKYAVIDNVSVIISSENWKYTGIPVNNTYGNRGWGVVLRNETVAEYFTRVFFADWSDVVYDIIPFTPEDPDYGNASPDFEVDDWIETGYYNPVFPSKTLEGEFTVSPVIAPDTALLESNAVLGMINSASESILIEQLEVSLNWNDGEKEIENLYLKAAIEAAEKRHVSVKILLSSVYAYSDDPDLDNYDTYLFINDYASNHNITEYLEARLVDYDTLGLSKMHNKGMIVDGNKTLISSINWKRNSVAQNREVGVIIESEDVALYFSQIFLWDWNEPPIADAGRDITVRASDAVQFESLSFDSDDNILNYFWNFDDGTNSTEENPVHIFEEEGVYEVSLTVFDGQYSDSDTITVIVLEPEAESVELGTIVYAALLLIFLGIFVIIIVFLRKMRLRFL
ncbi:MAG: lamin tail domain-containing protein, partial [Methanomassiliicoccales archaeon]